MFARRARAAALRRPRIEAKGRSYAKQRALSNKILQAPQNSAPFLSTPVAFLRSCFEKGKQAEKLRSADVQKNRKNHGAGVGANRRFAEARRSALPTFQRRLGGLFVGLLAVLAKRTPDDDGVNASSQPSFSEKKREKVDRSGV